MLVEGRVGLKWGVRGGALRGEGGRGLCVCVGLLVEGEWGFTWGGGEGLVCWGGLLTGFVFVARATFILLCVL